MEKGYVHVYTGNGKGKTTTMLGLTLRATGAGFRVYIGQFLKSGEYSEVKALKQLRGVEIEQYGEVGFIINGATEKDIKIARAGFCKAKAAIYSGQYDVIMLDEINVAVDLGLIDVQEVVDLIKEKPLNVELVLTGRNAAPKIIEAADLVSEIMEVKHYYNAGVMARVGIED